MANEKSEIEKKIEKPDYAAPLKGGDFLLRELTLTSKSSPTNPIKFNVPGVFVELNIYEDLFENVLKGTFDFIDNQGIAELIPIIGDETLELSFSTPGGEGTKVNTDSKEMATLESGAGSEEAVKQRFHVYDCIEIGDEQKKKMYKLFFVSSEYVYSTKMKISKGYKGKRYHEIVKDALAKINKTPGFNKEWQKKAFIEETATPQNVIVPNWTPFQAINFCAARSLSSDITESTQDGAAASQLPFAGGSLFVFYEKLGTGFFYESIESMIIKQKSQKNIPMYQYIPKTAGGASRNLKVSFFGVEQFNVKGSFKSLENLGFGMYGSRLIAYDPIRMKYDEVKYDYYKKEDNPVTQSTNPDTGVTEESEDPAQAKDDSARIFADFIATDIHPTEKVANKLISEDSDFLGSNDASIKLATTTKSHDAMFVAPQSGNTSIGVTETTFKDYEAKPNQVESWLLQRETQMQEFGNIIVNFTVAGNSARHVGDLIRFELPTMISTDHPTTMATSLSHQLYSGYYVVSKIRHIITPDNYSTEMELIKNSFAKRIPGQKTKIGTGT